MFVCLPFSSATLVQLRRGLNDQLRPDTDNQRVNYFLIFVVDYVVPFRNSGRVLFKDMLKNWRGTRSLKEAAAVLEIDYPSYRKYETGKRTPVKLAQIEIERRMNANPDGKR